MKDFTREVEAAIEGTGTISGSELSRWVRQGDLATRARVHALTATAWARIQPEPTMREQCDFMADYLLECLAENPATDGYLHNGSEAGHAIAAWLKHLAGIPEAAGVIAAVAGRLEALYRGSERVVRDRIETAALEHIFEAVRLRPFFEGWRRDPALRGAFARALEWGSAHEGN